jgi:Holliday junction resolvasome RuvABC DNA-binding subunit
MKSLSQRIRRVAADIEDDDLWKLWHETFETKRPLIRQKFEQKPIAIDDPFRPDSPAGLALSALKKLEYKDKQARKLIKEILAKQPQVDAKELVRLVLKQEKPE